VRAVSGYAQNVNRRRHRAWLDWHVEELPLQIGVIQWAGHAPHGAGLVVGGQRTPHSVDTNRMLGTSITSFLLRQKESHRSFQKDQLVVSRKQETVDLAAVDDL
jgi:hypothetical protein